MWLYALVAVLFLVAIGVQVLFLRRYASQVTRTAKVIMLVNIGMLTLLLGGLTWYTYTQAVR